RHQRHWFMTTGTQTVYVNVVSSASPRKRGADRTTCSSATCVRSSSSRLGPARLRIWRCTTATSSSHERPSLVAVPSAYGTAVRPLTAAAMQLRRRERRDARHADRWDLPDERYGRIRAPLARAPELDGEACTRERMHEPQR